MLRLFPLSVVILALILLRLSYVHGWLSPAQSQAGTIPPPARSASILTNDPQDLTPDGKKWIDHLAREALTAPTADQRSAAALAIADASTSKVADVLRAINAAEDVVMDNVRNADTTAYKSARWAPRNEKPGYAIDLTQGSLKSTNGQLDVAIRGDGFFAIRLTDRSHDAVGYTRAGNLFVNNKNALVVGIGYGYPLVPPITLPPGVIDVTIGQDGIVQVVIPDNGAKRTIGQLSLTRFTNPSALASKGTGIFQPTAESGPPTVGIPLDHGFGAVQQGFLEESNVDVIAERMRLKFLNNWRAALDEALAQNSKRGLAIAN